MAWSFPVRRNWGLASLLPLLCEVASALDGAKWAEWEGAEPLFGEQECQFLSQHFFSSAVFLELTYKEGLVLWNWLAVLAAEMQCDLALPVH